MRKFIIVLAMFAVLLLALFGCLANQAPSQLFSQNKTLTYTLMQCQKMPWQTWYENGGINFIKEPTEKELAAAYFSSELKTELLSFERTDKKIIACQACNTCPTGTSYVVVISDGDGVQKLAAMGWKISD